VDDCRFCEPLIAEAEGRVLWAPEDAGDADEMRYERWLEGWRP
jgi:hypothetical protein